MIKIRIDGIDDTILKIDNYDIELRNKLKALVKTTAKAVTKKAKQLAPVGKTGNLKRSIKAKYLSDFSATVAPRRPKGSHRHLVEYGTKVRSTRSRANRSRMPSKPFMEPAKQSQESTYYQKVRSIVNKNEVI